MTAEEIAHPASPPPVESAARWWQRYEVRLLALFLLLLFIYLVVAILVHTPRGYYGTIEQPRFADPWIARSETIINGGLLYRDTFTSTPPLINLLIIPPSLVPIFLGNINPWATLSYMLWFSLFSLLAAYVLLYMGATRRQGFVAASLFLLNPLTLGNTVLRRQDESILVFFFALALLFVLRQQHVKAGIAIGLGLLVKLSAAAIIPVAFLHTRKWHYIVLPPLVFLLGMLPFFYLAGSDAYFWDLGTEHGQHPFQIHGVSLVALWNRYHLAGGEIPLLPSAIALIVGSLVGLAYIAWKRIGILEDVLILTSIVFLASPKVHTGYFSITVVTAALLIRTPFQAGLYFLFGILALLADFYKWPIEDFPIALGLMIATYAVLAALVVSLCRQKLDQRERPAEHRVEAGASSP